jgi:leucyl-tRNA synthetase
MYMGPLDAMKPWNTRDIVGVFRFLQRVWRLVVSEATGELVLRDAADEDVERRLHKTIAKVGEDIERLAFNTAIAAMIEFVNAANKAGGLTADQLTRFAVILAPFAPHMAEELWSRCGGAGLIIDAAWPAFDASLIQEDMIEAPVQIMGKVRSRIQIPADADPATVEAIALADDRIKELIEGKTVRKVIVKPKIVNIVVG